MDVRTDGDIADSFWWRRTTLTRRTPLYDACVSVGLLVAATIVGALLDHPGLAPSIMIVYVFAVQLCAFFTWSRLYCLLSSAAAVALYNFLFVDPRYSLSLIDRGYPGMFFIMFVVSLVSSSIALALRRALAQAAASDRRTHMVLETNRMLQRCADQHQIVHAMATQLARLSGCPVVWYSADAEGDDLLPRATYTAVGDAAPVHELAPQMPPRLSASAYVGTPLDATFGGSAFYGIYLTVRTGDGFVRSGDPASVVGVLAIVAEPDVLTHEERTLADAIVSEGELALDRARARIRHRPVPFRRELPHLHVGRHTLRLYPQDVGRAESRRGQPPACHRLKEHGRQDVPYPPEIQVPSVQGNNRKPIL